MQPRMKAGIEARAVDARRIRGASEQVAEERQRAIAGRGLVPGDRLGTEEDLAREFGVSRPTLREAVRLLASVNLVRATKGPGGGVFVARTPEQGMGRTVSDAIARMLDANATTIVELLGRRVHGWMASSPVIQSSPGSMRLPACISDH